MTFEESLSLLYQTSTDDYDGLQKVYKTWSALPDEEATVNRLYDQYFTAILTLLERHGSSPEEASGWFQKTIKRQRCVHADVDTDTLHAYKFVTAFSSGCYLASWTSKKAAETRLKEQHLPHLDLIEKALSRSDFLITPHPLGTSTGKWGDIVASMLSLYARHLKADEESTRILLDAARLAHRFYHAFPDQNDIFITNYLAQGADPLGDTIELIRFYFLQRNDGCGGPMENLASEMLGIYAEKSNFFCKNSAEILRGVLVDAGDWPPQAVKTFVSDLVLGSLNLSPLSQQMALDAACSERDRRRGLISRLTTNTEQSRRVKLERYVAEGESTLLLIEKNFAEWDARRKAPGIQRLSVSATTRKALKVIAEKVPTSQKVVIEDVLQKAAARAAYPKKFPMPVPSQNQFSDVGLKLLVIEELMYQRRLLTPVFDVHEFVKEFDKREISIESDGYEIIPEVLQYFRNLPIPAELLAQVEHLHQSSGLDGGSELIYQIYPFWDPGCGDEPIKVTNKAIADLQLLPNLRCISGLENSQPDIKLLQALQAGGIALVSEEDAL